MDPLNVNNHNVIRREPYQVLNIIEESIYEKSMWDPFDVNSHINQANYINY